MPPDKPDFTLYAEDATSAMAIVRDNHPDPMPFGPSLSAPLARLFFTTRNSDSLVLILNAQATFSATLMLAATLILADLLTEGVSLKLPTKELLPTPVQVGYIWQNNWLHPTEVAVTETLTT